MRGLHTAKVSQMMQEIMRWQTVMLTFNANFNMMRLELNQRRCMLNVS